MAFTEPLLLSTYSTVVKDLWKTSNVKKHIHSSAFLIPILEPAVPLPAQNLSNLPVKKRVRELSHEPEANKSHFAQAAGLGKLLATIRKPSATTQPAVDIS